MTQNNPVCPKCQHKLKTIIYGLTREDIDKENYVLGGCACYGDDRDATYFCSNCKSQFGKNLKPIQLIKCPAISSGAIFPEECKNYSLMKSKKRYGLLDTPEKVCELICPNTGKEVIVTLFSNEQFVGICKSTSKQTYKFPYNTLWMTSVTEDKKEDIILPIHDIKSIELTHTES